MKRMTATLFVFAIVWLSADAAIFTRWGRTSCVNNALELMRGFMATSPARDGGSGANYICLNSRPDVWGFGNVVPGDQPFSGWVEGVSYAFHGGYGHNAPFSYQNNGGQDLDGRKVPCIVCYRKESQDVAMFMGTIMCPYSSMFLEYRGYAVSSYSRDTKTETVCLDWAPEATTGAAGLTAYVYPVQVSCAALACPPYVAGYEIPCVVCTI